MGLVLFHESQRPCRLPGGPAISTPWDSRNPPAAGAGGPPSCPPGGVRLPEASLTHQDFRSPNRALLLYKRVTKGPEGQVTGPIKRQQNH